MSIVMVTSTLFAAQFWACEIEVREQSLQVGMTCSPRCQRILGLMASRRERNSDGAHASELQEALEIARKCSGNELSDLCKQEASTFRNLTWAQRYPHMMVIAGAVRSQGPDVTRAFVTRILAERSPSFSMIAGYLALRQDGIGVHIREFLLEDQGKFSRYAIEYVKVVSGEDL